MNPERSIGRPNKSKRAAKKIALKDGMFEKESVV